MKKLITNDHPHRSKHYGRERKKEKGVEKEDKIKTGKEKSIRSEDKK
jgi:hypothetical protein